MAAYATPGPRPAWPQTPAQQPFAGPSHAYGAPTPAPAHPPQPLYPALPAAGPIAPYNAQQALASTSAASNAGALALFGNASAPRTGSDVLQAAATLVDEQLKGDVAGKIDAAASLGGPSGAQTTSTDLLSAHVVVEHRTRVGVGDLHAAAELALGAFQARDDVQRAV